MRLSNTATTILLTLFTPVVFSTPAFDPDPALSNAATFAADWATIQQTLYLFSIAVDTKNYALLNDIFTPTATANFSTPSSQNISGLAAITALLSKGLTGVVSQHSLTTLAVDFQSPTLANSTQYLTTTFLGQGNLTGQVYVNYGSYKDRLELQNGGKWLINHRDLVNVVSECTFPYIMKAMWRYMYTLLVYPFAVAQYTQRGSESRNPFLPNCSRKRG